MILGMAEEVFQLDDLNNESTEMISKRFTLLLQSAVDEHFLERMNMKYQFSHDKLQFTFQCIIDQAERERLHLVIGHKLLKQSNDASKHQAAVHLNLSGRYLTNGMVDRVKLAKTNLEASKYCEFRAAFRDSVSFLRAGLMLLTDSEEKWSVNFDLSFEMTESLARMEFIIGNFKACEIAIEEALRHAKSIQMKIGPMLLDIELRLATNKPIDIVGRKILRQLGVVIPRIITPFHVKKLGKIFAAKVMKKLAAYLM